MIITYYVAADYSARSQLMSYIKTIIDEIAAKEVIKEERKKLEFPANLYKMWNGLQEAWPEIKEVSSKKEQRQMEQSLSDLRKLFDENNIE